MLISDWSSDVCSSDLYGFGTDKTPQAFRSACTRFIDVGALTSARETPVELAESTEEPPSPDAPEVAPDLVKLLIDAYNAVKRDDQGFARLSEVGQLAGNRSSFDPRHYGFKRLSDLVRRAEELRVGTTCVGTVSTL